MLTSSVSYDCRVGDLVLTLRCRVTQLPPGSTVDNITCFEGDLEQQPIEVYINLAGVHRDVAPVADELSAPNWRYGHHARRGGRAYCWRKHYRSSG